MTNIEVIVLVGGLILLLIVCLVALQQGRPDLANAPAANPNWDAAAAAVWNQRLQGASDDFGLGASQNSSKNWGAAITTLLGVFASVAVVKGPDTLTDLPTNWGLAVGWIVLLSLAILVIAVLLAIIGEQGAPSWATGLDAWKYRWLTEQSAKRSVTNLRRSRYLTLLAVVGLTAAVGVTWITGLESSSSSGPTVIASTGEKAYCGTVISTGSDKQVTLKTSTGAKVPLTGVTITPVDSCP